MYLVKVLFMWLNGGVAGGPISQVFLTQSVHIQCAHHIPQRGTDWNNQQSSIHLWEGD